MRIQRFIVAAATAALSAGACAAASVEKPGDVASQNGESDLLSELRPEPLQEPQLELQLEQHAKQEPELQPEPQSEPQSDEQSEQETEQHSKQEPEQQSEHIVISLSPLPEQIHLPLSPLPEQIPLPLSPLPEQIPLPPSPLPEQIPLPPSPLPEQIPLPPSPLPEQIPLPPSPPPREKLRASASASASQLPFKRVSWSRPAFPLLAPQQRDELVVGEEGGEAVGERDTDAKKPFSLPDAVAQLSSAQQHDHDVWQQGFAARLLAQRAVSDSRGSRSSKKGAAKLAQEQQGRRRVSSEPVTPTTSKPLTGRKLFRYRPPIGSPYPSLLCPGPVPRLSFIAPDDAEPGASRDSLEGGADWLLTEMAAENRRRAKEHAPHHRSEALAAAAAAASSSSRRRALREVASGSSACEWPEMPHPTAARAIEDTGGETSHLERVKQHWRAHPDAIRRPPFPPRRRPFAISPAPPPRFAFETDFAPGTAKWEAQSDDSLLVGLEVQCLLVEIESTLARNEQRRLGDIARDKLKAAKLAAAADLQEVRAAQQTLARARLKSAQSASELAAAKRDPALQPRASSMESPRV